ncbi:hypothetical protein ANTQUA_LOCUS8042 [Anthophora quadrimaculata]
MRKPRIPGKLELLPVDTPVMRVAIFKMMENRETTVLEMINRSVRCFPAVVCHSGKRRLFQCRSACYFAIKSLKRELQTSSCAVLMCCNQFAARRHPRELKIWTYHQSSISFILRIYNGSLDKKKHTVSTWDVVERAIQIEAAVFSTHVPLKQKLQRRMMELCGRKL